MKVKDVIREKGHSYRTIGEEIGCSKQHVHRIATGLCKSPVARYALASALDVDVETLFGDDGQPSRVGHGD